MNLTVIPVDILLNIVSESGERISHTIFFFSDRYNLENLRQLVERKVDEIGGDDVIEITLNVKTRKAFNFLWDRREEIYRALEVGRVDLVIIGQR